jgi:DNA-binding MarR family transcriptional regulator
MTFSAGADRHPERAERGGPDNAMRDMFGREVGSVDGGLNVLLEACERAVEGIGSSVPAVQLRALLIIDRAGTLNLNQLAGRLGASASASSKLCDRMTAAGLLSRERAAGSRREIVLVLTESGRRLAGWVREQRRGALDELLGAMGTDGREALVRGLRALAAGPG